MHIQITFQTYFLQEVSELSISGSHNVRFSLNKFPQVAAGIHAGNCMTRNRFSLMSRSEPAFRPYGPVWRSHSSLVTRSRTDRARSVASMPSR